jgi:nucleoside 2-deoxyribosyltransferase
MNKLIYLAGAYSYNPEEAFLTHIAYAAKIINMGFYVFSPIAHNHPLAVTHELPTDAEFWKSHNTLMLNKCDELWVIADNGWKNSKGTQFEIAAAINSLIPVRYIALKEGYVRISYNEPEAI